MSRAIRKLEERENAAERGVALIEAWTHLFDPPAATALAEGHEDNAGPTDTLPVNFGPTDHGRGSW